MDKINEKLKKLPAADAVMESRELAGKLETTDRRTVLDAVRKALEMLRRQLLAGAFPEMSPDAVARSAAVILDSEDLPSLRPVINATGIIIHTNLGRAKLNSRAAERAAQIACSYSTLEYDLQRGERGSRHDHCAGFIAEILGAEAAMVVNNNAAATLLCLVALSCGKEVIVSRGELVEIGGSFRVPEIMKQGGTTLREVGTTNKTHFSDYQEAICEKTGALMKVHTSNYRIVGFAEVPEASQLAELAHLHGIPFIYDLGSGLLCDLNHLGIDEPTAQKALALGADVVLFSGDKLLGGPQAGIIVGKRKYIELMKNHQLARVVRVDKMTLAALEETMRIYRDSKRAALQIPVLSMVTKSPAELSQMAENFAALLNSLGLAAEFKAAESVGRIGGGSAPMLDIPGSCVTIETSMFSSDELAERLRLRAFPIIVRINEGKVLIDMRTVSEEELDEIRWALVEIFAS